MASPSLIIGDGDVLYICCTILMGSSPVHSANLYKSEREIMDIKIFTSVDSDQELIQCGACQRVYGQPLLKQNKDYSIPKQCCQPILCSCGEEIDQNFYIFCKNCRPIERKKKILARAENAEEIPLEEHRGWVYDPFAELFHSDLSELAESCENEEMDLPSFVHGCFTRKPRVNFHNILPDTCTDNENGADWENLAELEKAIDDFNSAQRYDLVDPDYSTIVKL